MAREHNEQEFVKRGFTLEAVGGNEPAKVQQVVGRVTAAALLSGGASAFDISSMTRAWHGALVRELWTTECNCALEVFFAYAPAQFRRSAQKSWPNEFVEPAHGFAALSTPDLPVAAVIGLGSERERALGLQQWLDPSRTMLLVPNSGAGDRFHAEVRKSNRDLLARTPHEWVFPYSPFEPAATFSMLASIVDGLRSSYRVVLASLGPKIFGLLCFLLATKFDDVSVWRVSSGVHAHPRDAHADLEHLTVVSTIWESSGAH
jgi:hypothetical protein